VLAYRASEQSLALGLRIKIHPRVMRQTSEKGLNALAVPLLASERSENASHEVRWLAGEEVVWGTRFLDRLRRRVGDNQRALAHYDASKAALERVARHRARPPFEGVPLRTHWERLPKDRRR
jgi:hypothetical protein